MVYFDNTRVSGWTDSVHNKGQGKVGGVCKAGGGEGGSDIFRCFRWAVVLLM